MSGEFMQEDILRQIGTIARALDSIANSEFKDMQLSRGQYLYLTRIKENPGIISDHLANLLNVDRTTTARSVQKLVKNDLVEKRPDKNNKKIRHLFVTPRGQELAEQIEKENRYSNELVLAGLSQEQSKQLAVLLKTVEENASENWRFVKNGGRREY
jgi:DNA-binding MarR family transcriptional regulator